jgi:Kyakuja-Dileera-Zisupton transposase
VRAAHSRPLQNLVTAVGVAVCRHGMLLRLMNLFTGERHAYATAAVLSLLATGTSVLFWWYDIACR